MKSKQRVCWWRGNGKNNYNGTDIRVTVFKLGKLYIYINLSLIVDVRKVRSTTVDNNIFISVVLPSTPASIYAHKSMMKSLANVTEHITS